MFNSYFLYVRYILIIGTYRSMYACSVVFCLDCIESMILFFDSLFVAMLMPYSLMTYIKIYFIRNTPLTVPSSSSTTHFLVLHAEVK